MKVRKPDVAPLVTATFPDYTGRKFRVEAVESVLFSDLNYSGGTRNQFRACTIDGQSIESKFNLNQPPPWANPFEGKRVELPAGAVVVEHSMFCGKDCGLTIYVNPADMPRTLMAGQVERLRRELEATGVNVSADCIATALQRGDSEAEIRTTMNAIMSDIIRRESA